MPLIHLLPSLTTDQAVCGARPPFEAATNAQLVSCPHCLTTGHQAISEKALQAALVREATRRGYLVYHTYASTRSAPGWPDLAIVADGLRPRPLDAGPLDTTLYLLECKRTGEHPSAAQQRWLAALQHVTRVKVDVVWPETYAQWVQRWQEDTP